MSGCGALCLRRPPNVCSAAKRRDVPLTRPEQSGGGAQCLEEPMRAGSRVDVRSGVLTGGEMQLAGADLLHPEPFRGLVEMTAELCDRVDVG